VICCLVSEGASKPGALVEIARACSPRVESHGERVVVFDASGLTRVIGTSRQIASEVAALAVEQGLMVRIALAPSVVAAWLMAHAQIGQTVVEPSRMVAMLGELPLSVLATLPVRTPPNRQLTKSIRPIHNGALLALERWGLRTLAQVAKLPRNDLHARLGEEGVLFHMAACGEDAFPLVPAGAAAEFLERMVLEWPIEGLEPLSFVLARLLDALSVSLERADRGAVTVTTRLKLVNRMVHERTLNLPAPMRDSKVLRTLIVLDLESNPPHAGIDEVTIEIGVVPGRIVQGSLLDRALPSPEQLATLTARLAALAGEARVGAPLLQDTHDDRHVALKPFTVSEGRARSDGGARRDSGAKGGGTAKARAKPAAGVKQTAGGISPTATGRPMNYSPSSIEPPTPKRDNPRPLEPSNPRTVLRRFRLPVPARVIVERGGPVRLVPSSSAIPSGNIVNRAGPWRTSGRWWSYDKTKWDRDEWDVELANGGCYRLARIRETGQWEIEGEMD
jgi:protein ImuB